ncbi:MAG: MvaI/BcnI family restriction endonuclease [Aestuariivita sp.]|nr:MvaI/BcnI family restriction endonuclease [Aestuariivita sp.]
MAGNYLEDQLGVQAGNMDIADTLGWELKWYTPKTNLLTLFHQQVTGPPDVMLSMVRKYGRKDVQGRMSLRHTIKGKLDKFRTYNDSNRLIMVRGEKDGRKIRFTRADAYENFHLADFIWEIMSGTIAIDFDVRAYVPGSKRLRNHGTKFRVPPDAVCRLYLKKDRIAG